MADTPLGRKKNIQSGGSGVARRGEGLGTGPVGQGAGGSFGQGGSGGHRDGGNRGMSPIMLIIIAAVVLLGGGGGLSAFLGDGLPGGDDSSQYTSGTYTNDGPSGGAASQSSGHTGTSSYSSYGMGDLFGSLYGGSGAASSASWIEAANTGTLDRNVSDKARPKRTVIKGGGADTVTVLLYMCGTDLESRSAMATKDLQEMLAATPSDRINLIVYTGGCKKWQNNVISSSTNQIYQIKDGKMFLLKDNIGNLPMVDENTLADFIKWGVSNYPADRYELILWDHGGGSVSGYGYDEKFAAGGSMPLDAIDRALKAGGVDFDFIGFDACLMATVETGLMAADHADYMIASEETEPGVGWYYTTWLNDLAANTSIDTRDLGKSIIDSFTQACNQTCPGQKTTLSLVDLAELSATVPDELSDFSGELSSMVDNGQYSTISTARNGAREFAVSSKIDQVDLVNFLRNIGSKEANELADALKSAVKYNRTSSNMTNAFGISAYFPMKKLSRVDTMVNTYKAIGMDDSYSACIRKVAKYGAMGQYAGGGTSQASPVSSILGQTGASSYAGSSSDVISGLLSSFLGGGDFSSIGLGRNNAGFMEEELDIDAAARSISENLFDPLSLVWSKDSDGCDVMSISEEQWALVRDLDMGAFYDDGTGYVDLGLDNTFDITGNKALIAPEDKTWLAIDGQIVAYYRLDSSVDGDHYTITGRVPAYLNGDRVNLILIFDSEHEDGYVAGASYDYRNNETETIAKNLTELSEGDTIDFVCDYYDYSGSYMDSYYLGEQYTVKGSMSDLKISNRPVGDGALRIAFRFTDIYDQVYWTPAVVK